MSYHYERKQSLVSVFAELGFLCRDIEFLIIEYEALKQWEMTAASTWGPIGYTYIMNILGYQDHIYVCYANSRLLAFYDTKGNLVQKPYPFLTPPTGMDVDQINDLLYLANRDSMWIQSLSSDQGPRWSWPLPKVSGRIDAENTFRGIKVNDGVLYLTIDRMHQVFVCNPQDGSILHRIGTAEPNSTFGAFHYPRGITVNRRYVYVCDSVNHRVQILNQNGQYVKQWGLFTGPYSICHHLEDDTFFVGDSETVQIFTQEGRCIQRLGNKKVGNGNSQFRLVIGLCVLEDRLFVADYHDSRLHIFQIKR